MKRYILAGLLTAVSFGLIINMTSAQMVGDVDPGTDSTVVCTNLTHNLRLGSRDSSTNGQVTILQEFLVMKGLLLVDPTGYFGPATLAAAKAYQSQAGLLTSGYVGPLTRAAIKAASCGASANPISTDTTTTSVQKISLSSPSAGQSITLGKPVTIGWVYTGAPQNSQVVYTIQGVSLLGGGISGGSGQTIALAAKADSGYYSWPTTSGNEGYTNVPGTYDVYVSMNECNPSGCSVAPSGRILARSEVRRITLVAPTSTNSEQPVITSISKTSAPVGATVTAYGRNLKDGLYVSWGGANGWTFSPSSIAADGSSFTFVVPNVKPGVYELSANKREDNASYNVINTVSFTVTSATGADTTYRNFLAGTQADCNALIVSSGFWQPAGYSCSIGGGCSVSGLPPNSSSPTANPNTWGACVPSSEAISPSATPPSITITPDITTTFGGNATITWNVMPTTGVSCVSAGGNLANGTITSTSGSWTTPNLYTTTQYGMRCTNNTNGLNTTKYVTVTVPSQTAGSTSASAPTITLTPDSTVAYGGKTTLSWSVTPTTGIFCESAGGNLAAGTVIGASGSWTTPNLYTTTQYGMRCKNTSNGLMSYKYTTVNVNRASSPSLSSVSPVAITVGANFTLTGSNFTTGGNPAVELYLGGSLVKKVYFVDMGFFSDSNIIFSDASLGQGDYQVRVVTPNGSSNYLPLLIKPASGSAPTISVTANGLTLSEGGTVTATNGSAYITWSSTGANSCTLNGNSLASSGSQTITGLTNGTHTFICTNSYGSKSLTFNVNVPSQTQTPSAWLYLPGSASSNGTVSASWSGSNSPTSYKLKIDGVEKDMGTATSWSGSVSSLGLGVGSHTFYVQACNAAGCGAWDGPYFLNITAPTAYAPVAQTAVLGASTLCVDLPTNMHRGYESYGVTRLQEFLKSKNFIGEVTGFYGDKTVAAVKEYQSTQGLPQTGMVYDFTRAAIRTDSCQ